MENSALTKEEVIQLYQIHAINLLKKNTISILVQQIDKLYLLNPLSSLLKERFSWKILNKQV